MSTGGENFDYEGFIKDNNFLKPLTFNKIYEKFNNEYRSNTDGEAYCNAVKDQLSISSSNAEHISHFCNILYKIIFNLKRFQNDLYEKEPEDYKMYCSLLKYWLFEEKQTLPILQNTDHIYQSAKNKLEFILQDSKTFPCTFYELDWKDMIKLRKIYAFVLIYYSNLHKFHKENFIYCKYLDYLGKGLIEFYSNMSICSKKLTQDNFCNELMEIKNNYKLDNLHLIHSTENTDYQFEADKTVGCPLEIKSMNEPFHLLYKEGKNRWLLTDEPIASLNSIISASSAIGATVGISSFLVYLFKFTNIGSLFNRGKQDDNTLFLNIDEGTYDFTYPISETEHNNFGNSPYNISYYSVGNS